MKFKGFISAVILASFLVLSFSSCSSHEAKKPPIIIKKQEVVVQENAVPGTVSNVWEERMVDVVEVPGQVDPTNTYYRLPHKALYEIRPGKYQELE